MTTSTPDELDRIDLKWRDAFSRFVETGEADDDFLDYLNQNREAQNAAEAAFAKQAARLGRLAEDLRPEPESPTARFPYLPAFAAATLLLVATSSLLVVQTGRLREVRSQLATHDRDRAVLAATQYELSRAQAKLAAIELRQPVESLAANQEQVVSLQRQLEKTRIAAVAKDNENRKLKVELQHLQNESKVLVWATDGKPHAEVPGFDNAIVVASLTVDTKGTATKFDIVRKSPGVNEGAFLKAVKYDPMLLQRSFGNPNQDLHVTITATAAKAAAPLSPKE